MFVMCLCWFGVCVLSVCDLFRFAIGVSAVWRDFGGLSGMFLIVVLIESMSVVLFLPSSVVLSMCAMMSVTACVSGGILW